MNPAEERHALRGRNILSCWDLWVTAILHAILIGALALVLNAPWVVSGMLIWVGDIGAYWLIRSRRGLKHALVFGAIMTIVWTLMLLAGLAREFMTVNEDIIY